MTKKVLIELDDVQATKVDWLADRFGCTPQELFLSLIPNLPEKTSKEITKEVSVSEIAGANITNMVPIKEDFDREKVRQLVNKLILHSKGWGSTLGKEICRQTLDVQGKHLTVGTFKRLGRWISPYRNSERERYVSPIAKDVSKELFGYEIERYDT